MRIYRSVIRAIEPGHVDEFYFSGDRQSVTVIEDTDARDTGILDHRGNPIYAVNEIGPIGFNKA